MSQATVLENINKILENLPESTQIQVLNYLETLSSQNSLETHDINSVNTKEAKPKKRDGFGIWKGKISMAEDFDKPLEDMKEYL